MSFNKRYICEENIRKIAILNDYVYFYKYFISDAIFLCDNFSENIFNKIQKCKISEKNKIIKIMNKCK